MSKSTRRRGFTLPEVLVTVTIVAVLAAVVVPAVLNQVSKGDDSAAGSDITAVRTAITTFTADTRKFPGAFNHMSGSSLSADSLSGDSTATYGAVAAAAYHGPYIQGAPAGHITPTGAVFRNRFVDSTQAHLLCLKDSVPSAADSSLVTRAQAAQIDKVLDNNDGKSAGNIRWKETTVGSSVVDSASFRACIVTR